MDELKIERLPYAIWENTGDVITDHCKPFCDICDMLEIDAGNCRDEKIYDYLCDVVRWMFNFGFFQGIAWSKGGGIE